jgi:HD-GYP domain-containing protein (c-di-GMP phosphodiesterase class II)
MMLPYICLEVIGILAALVWTTTPVITPLLVIPAITTYIAFEMIHRLQRQTQEAMIAMADAIDQRDPYTADHSRRVAELAVRIAEVHGVNERDVERLRIAARMHDIGKIGIGNDLLHKPGKLTDDEWEILRAHPVIGEQLLKPYRQFRHETRLVRHHHERWDGKGYPDRIRGQSIPLGARIIAVADTFDAMTTSRPYRPALSRQYAIDEIRNGALSQFDPQIVASFLQVMEESSKIRSITGEDLPPTLDELEQAPAWYSSLP